MTKARKIFDDAILPHFEETRAAWLDRARHTAIAIAKKRGVVTADDVHDQIGMPASFDGRVMGGVFIKSIFKKVGYRNSRRRICHGRPVAMFELVK